MITPEGALEVAVWAAVYSGELVKGREAAQGHAVDGAVKAADHAVSDMRRVRAEQNEREAAKTPPATPAAKAKR